jgi:hypothetical protein
MWLRVEEWYQGPIFHSVGHCLNARGELMISDYWQSDDGFNVSRLSHMVSWVNVLNIQIKCRIFSRDEEMTLVRRGVCATRARPEIRSVCGVA